MKIIEKYSQLPDNLFRLIFWNIFFAFLVIFLFSGLLALFGIRPVSFNDEPTYGILGFVMSLLMAPIMSLVTAFTIWLLFIIGNFIMKTILRFKTENG